jgi:HCOMODA/2-hydroxy-3-carboxy-muconic semialdehyde decarboxylase
MARVRLAPWSRRHLLRAALSIGAFHAIGSRAALAQPANAAPVLPAALELGRLVAANRILANESIVDAFGHVSVRDPRRRDRFVMARSVSPALVAHDDLMEFELDGTPVAAAGRTPYGERMIHGAVYEGRPDVEAVVHHHAYSVLPFAVTGEPLTAVIHTASVIGTHVPVWDIRDRYGDTDMLVRTIEQGRDLAAALGDNTCLVMRGHGAVVVGANVQRAVLTAIYLHVNAAVLLEARRLRNTVEGLSAAEIERSAAAQFAPLALDRAWEYFCRRAGVEPI